VDNTGQVHEREVRSGIAEKKGVAVPRREALKSLVAGFSAVPLLNEAAARGQQRESVTSEISLVENTRDQLFDRGWRFYRGDVPGAERPEFDDSAWGRSTCPTIGAWKLSLPSSNPRVRDRFGEIR
jgi:hypothetical protein